MFNKTGTVEAVRKDGKGIKMDDGQWYSSFLPVKGIRAGMSVAFTYTTVTKDTGTFNNIKGAIVEDSSGASASSGGGSAPAPRSGGTTSDKEKQLMIIRQNALTNAVTYFNCNFGTPTRTTECTAEIKEDVASIVMIASAFTRFTAGELDNDAKAAIEAMSVAAPLASEEKDPF